MDVFNDLQQVTFVELDDQDELNRQVIRSLQAPINKVPSSNLRQGLELGQSCTAWRDLILND